MREKDIKLQVMEFTINCLIRLITPARLGTLGRGKTERNEDSSKRKAIGGVFLWILHRSLW